MVVVRLVGLTLAMLACLATRSFAGPLLSATFTTSTQIYPAVNALAVSVTSTTATGTLVGSQFGLGAGSWFATQQTVPLTGPFPITGVGVTVGQNGALSGSLGAQTFVPAGSPPNGLTGHQRLRVKIGGRAGITVLIVPFNAGAGVTSVSRATTTTSPSVSASVQGGRWRFGSATTALTAGFVPNGTAMVSGGGVAVTPGGDTIITLVSLSRVRVRGRIFTIGGYTVALGQTLSLRYAPEPSTPVLLATAVAVLAAGVSRTRRRRTRSASPK